jgi:hypothetical protein
VDGKGAVSIQSDPCAKGSREVWKRDTAAMAAEAKTLPAPSVTGAPSPRPPPPPAATTPGAPPGAHPPPGPPRPAPPADGSLAPASVESLEPIGPDAPAANACDQAKDIATRLRDMPWLELTGDQQQKLLRWVMEQCRQGSAE